MVEIIIKPLGIQEKVINLYHLYIGADLDLTAIAIGKYKHVEPCGEARKSLVTKHN